jgi:hypothetical protein
MDTYKPKKIDRTKLSSNDIEMLNEFSIRRKIVEEYLNKKNINLKCYPCCAYPTLNERGAYEICAICFWEDDDQDDDTSDEVWGGPNGELSLTEERLIFEQALKEYEEKTGSNRISNPIELLLITQKILKDFELFLSNMPEEIEFDKFIDSNITKTNDFSIYASLTK